MSNPLSLGLMRPQYVNVPETFGTALGWSGHRAEQSISKPTVGLRYRSSDKGSSNLAYHQTAPHGDEEFARFGSALAKAGLKGEASPEILGRAVVNSFMGLSTENAKSDVASPLTPHATLLQDVRGLTGAANPPDIAAILEQLFALGTASSGLQARTVADLWTHAQGARLATQPLLAAVDSAIKDHLVPWARNIPVGDSVLGYSIKPGVADPQRYELQRVLAADLGPRTPFAWFNKAWTCLTREEWTEVLPGRVWVDWATTVLRLGYGLGFLWESAWYVRLAQTILGPVDSPIPRAQIVRELGEVVPWRSMGLGVQSRDVSVVLKRRTHRAVLIRELLDSVADPNEPFEAALSSLAGDAEVKGQLSALLRTEEKPPQRVTNLWEASKYALMTRETGGRSPDYYGLLQKRGNRYLYPDPGTEWIAVVASVTCGLPNTTATVGDIMADLASMGIRPELPDLVHLLERSGLARGSADADQAVLVQAAF